MHQLHWRMKRAICNYCYYCLLSLLGSTQGSAGFFQYLLYTSSYDKSNPTCVKTKEQDFQVLAPMQEQLTTATELKCYLSDSFMSSAVLTEIRDSLNFLHVMMVDYWMNVLGIAGSLWKTRKIFLPFGSEEWVDFFCLTGLLP